MVVGHGDAINAISSASIEHEACMSQPKRDAAVVPSHHIIEA